MPKSVDYIRTIRRTRYPGVIRLWDDVLAGVTPGWPAGRAFEYLVLRAFELEGATVRYPFTVNLPTGISEQIDGVIYHPSVIAMVESKDRDTVDAGPLAKLRSQLLRRPAGVVGLAFCTGTFTLPAVALARQYAPQVVLLWDGADVDLALRQRGMIDGLAAKFRAAVELGVFDYSLLQGGQP